MLDPTLLHFPEAIRPWVIHIDTCPACLNWARGPFKRGSRPTECEVGDLFYGVALAWLSKHPKDVDLTIQEAWMRVERLLDRFPNVRRGEL